MPGISPALGPGDSFALPYEGYSFIQDRCERLQPDMFQIRLLMQNTICMSGKTCGQLFYDDQLPA